MYLDILMFKCLCTFLIHKLQILFHKEIFYHLRIPVEVFVFVKETSE